MCDEKMTGETSCADLLVRLSLDLNGSFEDLMLAYQDRIYSFAFRLGGDARDAEEISQDAFVAAYRGLQGYEPERIRGPGLAALVVSNCPECLLQPQPAQTGDNS